METSFKFSHALVFILIIFSLSFNSFSQSGWVQQNSGITGNVTFIEAVDANNAFVGNPVFKTTNGGETWFSITAPTVSAMQMVNASTGYMAAGPLYPRKTTDGGLNWITLPLASPDNFCVSFINENTGIMGGLHDMDYLDVFMTTNGAASWFVRGVSMASWPENIQAFYDMKMINSNIIYVTYYVFHQFEPMYVNYYLEKSTDGGGGFNTVYNGAIFEMDFPSATTGFARTNYTIYKSVNDNWGTNVTLTTTSVIHNMEFPSVNTGYVACDGGVMYKTTNGGSNWFTLNTGTTRNLLGVKFINELTGWVVGDSGLILKTTTGGVEPHSVSGTVRYQDNNQPVPSGYVKALQYDEQTQNVITVDSTGINSNGTYMLPHCPPVELDIMAFQDDEEDNHFVPTFYVSTIYWENATHITPDTNLTNIDIGVYRINNNAGSMHVGGMVYKADEDNTAVLKDAIVYARIGNVFKGYSITGYPGTYCIDSLSSGIYEIIANRMGFYSAVRPLQLTTFSMDTIDFVLNTLLASIEPNVHNIPEKYFLSQNYPNPFNPQTKIKFGLPEQTHVKLVLFDVLGREVSVLVNEELKTGEYNVTWDASNLSSGIYFYRIETDKYTETRKMVLIK